MIILYKYLKVSAIRKKNITVETGKENKKK